jgi:hypothetical protein
MDSSGRKPLDDAAVLFAAILEQHRRKASARDVRRVEEQTRDDQTGAAVEALWGETNS